MLSHELGTRTLQPFCFAFPTKESVGNNAQSAVCLLWFERCARCVAVVAVVAVAVVAVVVAVVVVVARSLALPLAQAGWLACLLA
jgi:hypothetical protein